MRAFRSLAIVVLCALIVAGVGIVGGCSKQPDKAAAAPKKFEPTPTRLARGRYLTEGPMHCFLCHSEVDEDNLLPLPGKKGAGKTFPAGEFPFTVKAPNITPDPETGAGKWTDEQFVRVLRDGIGHDGRVLLPLMPYHYFRRLTDEDLASVVVYIRSLEPVHNVIQLPYVPDEIRKQLVAVEPAKGSAQEPDWKDPVKRGEYLVTLGACDGCHTSADAPLGEPLPGMAFAGGVEFVPFKVSSANITPSPSGISYYDEKMFLEVIRTGHVKARALKPIMPWRYIRNLSDDDLKAMFAYLRTVAPVQHRVDNSEPPTPCKLCKGKHGAGDRNDAFAAKVGK
jgi:mono/diheme cytochrome c family protein